MSLQEASYDMTERAMEGGQNPNRYQADNILLVKFFSHPRINETMSDTMGRPIYDDTDYIQIMQPGNKESIVRRPATDMDKNRFAEHYKKYQARLDQSDTNGTPLEQWPQVSRSQVMELKWFNIVTVEQLVNLSDVNAQNIMGIQDLKRKAARYLQATAGDADAKALEDKLALRDDQIGALMARLEVLEGAGEVLEDVPPIEELDEVIEEAVEEPEEPRRPRRRKKA